MDEKLVPKLRFKEFKDNWVKTKLGKYANINPKSTDLPEEFHYIDLESVEDGLLHNVNIIKKSKAPSRAKRLLNAEDILFQTVRPYQRNNFYFNLTNGEYVASTGYAQLRTDNNPLFLFYLLHTDKFVNNVLVRCTGTSYPAINSNDLNDINISYPSSKEQQKVSKFLSYVDKKIKLLEKQISHFHEFKRGLLDGIFSDKLRFPDFEDEWDFNKLGDVSIVKDGTHDSPKYIEKGYPLITSKNLSNGKLDLENIKFISEADYLSINKRSKVDKGDILFGMIGTLGNPVLVDSEGFAIKNVALIKQQEKLLNSFLIHVLSSKIIKKQFHKLNTGGTQKFIALGIIKDLIVPVPSIEEQNKITSALSNVDYKINNLKKQLDLTQEFKKGLLQQMFI